jgi:hypothetical protein
VLVELGSISRGAALAVSQAQKACLHLGLQLQKSAGKRKESVFERDPALSLSRPVGFPPKQP